MIVAKYARWLGVQTACSQENSTGRSSMDAGFSMLGLSV